MRSKTNKTRCEYRSLKLLKLFLLITLTLPISAIAADKPQTATNGSEALNPEKNPDYQEQSSQTPRSKIGASKTAPSKTKKTSGFKPSEVISEDYSVPFPVDI